MRLVDLLSFMWSLRLQTNISLAELPTMFRASWLTPLPLLLCIPVYAQVKGKIYKECLKAADYKGCVQILMQDQHPSEGKQSPLAQLRSSLQVLPSRLDSTNLRDYSSNMQQFRDAISLVDAAALKTDWDRTFYAGALRIHRMLDALQSAWSTRIYQGTSHTYSGSSSSTYYRCSILKPLVENFNYAAGRNAVVYNGTPQKGLFGGNLGFDRCSPQEDEMASVIKTDIAELLVDPAIVKAKQERDRREKELERMSAWNRHLEKNPSLKAWAKANPSAAKAAQEKWEAEQRQSEPAKTSPGSYYKTFDFNKL